MTRTTRTHVATLALTATVALTTASCGLWQGSGERVQADAPQAPTPRVTATPTPRPTPTPSPTPPVTPSPAGSTAPASPSPPSATTPSSSTPPVGSARPPAPAPSNPQCALAPTLPDQGRTLFGTSVSTSSKLLHQSLADEEARFGQMSVIRTFDPDVPPPGAWERRKAAVGDRMLVTSFRMPPQDVLAGTYDAQLRDYFRTAPTEPLILWSYIHEPEPLIQSGAFTAEQYRAAFRHVVRIAGEHCRANLFPTMILTGWTSEPESRRNWRDYYAGDDYVSVVAWDPYNSATSQPTSYAAPRALYESVLKASKQSGKPWGIAETGSVRTKDDPSGNRRGAWLDRIGQWFADQGATFVTYFQSTRDGEFILLDEPSVQAWKKWVRWSHG